MLFCHTDYSGTLFIRADSSGAWKASGDCQVNLGYAVGDNQTSAEEGVWARWSWDGTQLTVKNDRFGFLPIYYAHTPQGIGVSTSAMALVREGISSEFDDSAIAVFLRLGYYVGDDTPFKQVKTLPPGTELIWNDGNLSLHSHAPGFKGSVSGLSREEGVAAYGEILQRSVESMLPDEELDMALPLSAGRDSRHILYALLRAGRKPKHVVTTRSMAPRPDNDAQMASKIAGSLGLDHVILEQSEDRFGEEIGKNLLTEFCSDEHAHIMPMAHWLKNEKLPISWDGIAGDIISCGFYNDSSITDAFANQDYAVLCSWLLGEDAHLNKLLGSDAMQVWSYDRAAERLTQELKKYAELPNPAAPFFFYNRVRRELALAPYSILNQKTQVLAPYLSHELFDLLINLPFEYFEGREFHSEAIDQFYPEMPIYPYISVHSGSVLERRKRIWRYASQFISMSIEEKKNDSLLNKHALIPRLTKALISRNYGTSTPDLFANIFVVMQLQQTLREGV